MFTGLIETIGEIRSLAARGPGVCVEVKAPSELVGALTLGESVACDGACLTVIEARGTTFSVEASAETLGCTTLGQRKVGDSLHLERALALGARMGGHLVTGHIDATGVVREQSRLGDALRMRFEIPQAIAKYLVPKGSIAIDGISLTINQVDSACFDVVLVPHTQSIVLLPEKRPGDRVNIEADLIGKYVEHLLSNYQKQAPISSVSEALLRDAGFVS